MLRSEEAAGITCVINPRAYFYAVELLCGPLEQELSEAADKCWTFPTRDIQVIAKPETPHLKAHTARTGFNPAGKAQSLMQHIL